ncbi:MAG: hypothetical protein SH809_17240 [Rhodothermales bacterium]|nr:hypothetical protein [Rhodothermales bacterium]
MRRSLLLLLFCMAADARGQISLRTGLAQDKPVKPGMIYHAEILIRNDTAQPQEAKIYQTDYLFYADGTNEYGEPGSTLRSNATWIDFSPALLLIPPGETIPVNYSVTVPESVGGEPLSGTYWSMLMVEPIQAGDSESRLPRKPQAVEYGVRQVMRYGVQVATHIEEQARYDVSFTGVDLIAEADGRKVLEVIIENTGDAMISPSVWVEIYDAAGSEKERLMGSSFRLYPGTSVMQRMELNHLAKGNYEALIVVEAAGDYIVGAQYTLVL